MKSSLAFPLALILFVISFFVQDVKSLPVPAQELEASTPMPRHISVVASPPSPVSPKKLRGYLKALRTKTAKGSLYPRSQSEKKSFEMFGGETPLNPKLRVAPAELEKRILPVVEVDEGSIFEDVHGTFKRRPMDKVKIVQTSTSAPSTAIPTASLDGSLDEWEDCILGVDEGCEPLPVASASS